MRDTGFKTLLRESKYNFFKWGEYMKRAQLAERKLEKLKRLVLLTDDCVSDVQMNETAIKQWTSFITEFPDEGEKK